MCRLHLITVLNHIQRSTPFNNLFPEGVHHPGLALPGGEVAPLLPPTVGHGIHQGHLPDLELGGVAAAVAVDGVDGVVDNSSLRLRGLGEVVLVPIPGPSHLRSFLNTLGVGVVLQQQ